MFSVASPIQQIDLSSTVKTCLKQTLKKRTKNWFQDCLSLNVDQKYCRMLQESILQYFRPAFSYVSFVFKTFVLSIFEWPLEAA